jgi:SAM-dependent methyltransferase
LKHPLRALNGLLYSKLLSQNKDLKVAPGSRILDIGCGDGRYLLEKRSLGCICFGNDISLEALRRLRENAPDIETRCGDLWEVHYPEKYFDAINMSHVLEHVGEIDKLLIELRRIVKDSGLLRIQIPNAASLTCAIFGKCWIALDVPRHVYVFSLTNLKKFFSDAGFEIVSSRTIENSFSVIGSFFYVFNALFKKKFELLHCERIWNNEVLKLLLFPYSLVVNLCKVGDTAEFVLKKKVN